MSSHPLDPLTADEVRLAVAIVRREQDVSDRWRFASIELREPSKAVLTDFAPGTAFARAARVVCWNRDDGQTHTAVVSLSEGRVTSWLHQPDGQPNMTADEFHECDAAMRAEPRVIEALARRGIEDMDRVLIEALASLTLRDAVDQVAATTGLARRAVYVRALALAGKAGKAGGGADKAG